MKVSESTIELVNSSCRGIDDMTGASRHGHVDFFVLLFLLAGGGKGCLASKFTGLAQRSHNGCNPRRNCLGHHWERKMASHRKEVLFEKWRAWKRGQTEQCSTELDSQTDKRKRTEFVCPSSTRPSLARNSVEGQTDK